MSLSSLIDSLNMALIPLLATILSVISRNLLMPLGTFTTLSSNPSLESQPFPSNRSTAMMNFWLFVLNHSQIRIAPGFMHSSVTLWTICIWAGSKKHKCLLSDDGWNGHGKGKQRAD